MQFLVDENLPFSVTRFLRESNYKVIDVAESGFRGSTDETIWKISAEENRILVTRDLDFPLLNIKPFPLGIILIRVPDIFSTSDILELFKKFLNTIKIDELKNNIVVITPGKIRFRRLNKEGSE